MNDLVPLWASCLLHLTKWKKRNNNPILFTLIIISIVDKLYKLRTLLHTPI